MATDERLTRFLDLLNASTDDTVGTSVRLPANLRDAAGIAVEMGWVPSVTDLTVQGLRDALRAFSMEAVLEAHFDEHPEVRPTLAEVALAAAEMDGNPLFDRPELIEKAAAEVVRITDDPGPDEVLIYAAGLATAMAEAKAKAEAA